MGEKGTLRSLNTWTVTAQPRNRWTTVSSASQHTGQRFSTATLLATRLLRKVLNSEFWVVSSSSVTTPPLLVSHL
ncbi:hypothetical protein ES319_A02G139700v1 [Gossypium barbadense]|uniref:Uncharacterized protein n=2 Tax=Gossypium TaxID=3633 RepID=A0A5J5WPZ4_GOSBA|nr:hypothetical protein ES319_A02G139700v1 [Gossypium barbadense]